MKRLAEMKIGLIGLGQIGGSLGFDLVKRTICQEVIGYDKDADTLKKAKRLKASHRSAKSLKEAVQAADLVLIALPIRQTVKLLPKMCSWLKPEAAILDVTSTKVVIFEKLAELDLPVNYISGHPLAGNEGVGLEAAQSGLFERAPFVLMSAEHTSAAWLKKTEQLVRALGARPFSLEPERHDRLTSLSIQTPYFLAYLLSRMAVRQGLKDRMFWNVTGGSIQGATRVMKSSTELTLDMLLTNKDAVIGRIDELMSEMKMLKHLLKQGNPAELTAEIKATRKNLIKHS